MKKVKEALTSEKSKYTEVGGSTTAEITQPKTPTPGKFGFFATTKKLFLGIGTQSEKSSIAKNPK